MKIFKGKKDKYSWNNRYNFVDENNVFVGYDADTSCCEDGGYILSKTIPTSTQEPSIKIVEVNYIFDTSFFKEGVISQDELDSGGSVVFKMVNKNDPADVIYLTLFNCHNGYYGHGFDMTINDKIIHEGSL